MSNPYLNFLASLGGPSGSHSTLKKLASTSTTATPSPVASSASSSSSTPRTHTQSVSSSVLQPTKSKDQRQASVVRLVDSSHSRPRSPSRQHSISSASHHSRSPNVHDNNSHRSRPGSDPYSGRHNDRLSSKSIANGHGRPHSSLNGSRDSRPDKNERKRERNVGEESVDHSRANGSDSAATAARNTASDAADSRARKRVARSHSWSRSPSKSRSRSRSHSPVRHHSRRPSENNGSTSRHTTQSTIRGREKSPRRRDNSRHQSQSRSPIRSRHHSRSVSPSRGNGQFRDKSRVKPRDREPEWSSHRNGDRLRSRSRDRNGNRDRDRDRRRSRSRSLSSDRRRRDRSRSVSESRDKGRKTVAGKGASRGNSHSRSRSRGRINNRINSRNSSRGRSSSSGSSGSSSRSSSSSSSSSSSNNNSRSPSPVKITTGVPQLPAFLPLPPMPAIEELPQKTPTDQLYFSEIDGSSPFSTLSSPSSYSMSPPPQSTSRAVSPTKELTPLKKRRMDSTLYADDLSSTPSSLSSLSPNQSRQSTPDHEPHSTVPIVPPSSGRQNDEQAQRRHGSDHQPLHEHTNSPASLEMELFGLPAADKEKARANQVKDRSTIATRPSSKPGATKSISKKHSDSESDDGSFQNALGSLRKSSNNPETLPKKANGHSVVAPKSGQKTTPSSRRHLVIINTKTGSVTAHTGSGSSSTVSKVRNGSLGNSNGASKRPTVQAHTSTNGAGPRRMSILHSEQIVASAHGRYKNHFHMVVEDSDSTVASNPSSTSGDTMHTSLEYPGKDAREKFTLMKPFLSRSKLESDDKDEYNPIEDLVQTVRVIMEQFFSPEQRDKLFGTADEGLYRNLTKYKVRKDGIQFMKAVDEYNRIMRQEKTSGNIERFLKSYGRKLPYDLVVHILQQVYSRTVASRASRLNQYEAFSNNVYGEILPILTREFIRRTKLDHSKVFVDLGCGIGNVVLQVALQTGAESHGVEIMDTPAKFAKKQAKEFEARTQAYGLAHGSVNMIHGDFLETSELAAILARADVVLVNNYAFDSALNQSLLQLFLDLKDGAKVISLKTFVSLDHKINVRNAGSVESILRVRKYPYYTNAVSWTHNGGEYFIATVDRSAVQSFWESRM